MCAFLSDGFIYTHDRKAYGIRLLIFALVSELPFCLAFGRTGTFLFALICAANGEPLLHASGFFLAGILRILCYNGEKGNTPGSLFYLFYPVHLFVFGLLAR